MAKRKLEQLQWDVIFLEKLLNRGVKWLLCGVTSVSCQSIGDALIDARAALQAEQEATNDRT